MGKLYEIANDYAKLMSEDMDPEMIADTIEGIEGEFEDKLEQMLGLIKNEKAYSEALKAESKALADRSKATENRVTKIQQYIIKCMQTMEKSKLTAGVHSLTVRKPSVSVFIDDADKLPVDLVEYETTVKPDKNAIKIKLKAGEEIPGAHLKTGKPSLLIK